MRTPPLQVHLDGTGAWPDLDPTAVLKGQLTRLAAMPGAEPDAALRVVLLVEVAPGLAVFATVGWAELYGVVQALLARYGVPT